MHLSRVHWGKRATPPEDCRGAWGYLERRDQDFEAGMRKVLVVYQDVELQNAKRAAGQTASPIITVSVDDLGEGFALTAQTDRRIDPHRLIAYLHTAIESLVQALEQAAETLALKLEILPEQERLLIYFPLDTVTVLGPKVKELYDDFCNHRATNLKADENEIVSVEIDLNREKQT